MRSSLLHAVCAASLVCLGLAGEARAAYDPANEDYVERLIRFGQKKLIGKTDEEITKGRMEMDNVMFPHFHPKVQNFQNLSTLEDIEELLSMPKRPERVEGLDSELPFLPKAGGASAANTDWKVWVVMISAPESDALSRGYNDIWNVSLSLIFGEQPQSLLDSVKSALSPSDEDFEDASQSRERDIERDEASRLAKAKAERQAQNRAAAQQYNYGYVDYLSEPDLAWAWWTWKVPVIVFVTPSTSPDRAYDLRFWKISFMTGIDGEKMMMYIGSGIWLNTLPVWTSALAPGGDRDHIPSFLARPSNWLYGKASKVPRWLLAGMGTMLGGSLVQFLHGYGSKKGKKDDKKDKGEDGKSGAESATAESSSVKTKAEGDAGGSKKRK